MVTWSDNVHERAMAFSSQIAEATKAQSETGVDLSDFIKSMRKKIAEIYREELPLAHIFDESDLIFHAEGPATADENPWLPAFNWICNAADKRIRELAAAVFDLSDKNAKLLAKNLDLRFSGMAPGSLYAGFRIEPISAPMGLEGEDPVFEKVKSATRSLPKIIDFVGDDEISLSINDYVDDPALRDASLNTLMQLSPTGRRGIHTMDISSPGSPSSKLSTRERTVIRVALNSKSRTVKVAGKFSGDVRLLDLDSKRFHLRNVEGIGSIRCVFSDLSMRKARSILGQQVLVTGEYECNKEGRPRLMYVDDILVSPAPFQENM